MNIKHLRYGVKMGFETISEEGCEDYEVYTCDVCGWSTCLAGVGGDVAECPDCLAREYESQEDEIREEQRYNDEEGY